MKRRNGFKLLYAFYLAAELGFLIAVPLIGFLLTGVYLDKKFETHPLFVILSVFFSFLFVFFEIRHLFLPFLKRRK